MPSDILPETCADLLAVLARDDPDALRRAAATVRSQSGTAGQPSAATQLAQAWLAFAGEPAAAPAEVFHFTFPAHIAFEVVVYGGGAQAARREARKALAALDASDSPLGGVDGPLPGSPAIVNLSVWPGAMRTKGALELDDLELELADTAPSS